MKSWLRRPGYVETISKFTVECAVTAELEIK